MGHLQRRPSEEDQRVNLVDLTDSGAAFTLPSLHLSQEVSDRVLDAPHIKMPTLSLSSLLIGMERQRQPQEFQAPQQGHPESQE